MGWCASAVSQLGEAWGATLVGSALASNDLRWGAATRAGCEGLNATAWARHATGRATTAWRDAMVSSLRHRVVSQHRLAHPLLLPSFLTRTSEKVNLLSQHTDVWLAGHLWLPPKAVLW